MPVQKTKQLFTNKISLTVFLALSVAVETTSSPLSALVAGVTTLELLLQCLLGARSSWKPVSYRAVKDCKCREREEESGRRGERN